MKRFFLSTLILGLALAFAQTALAETLKKPEIDKLVAAQQGKVSPSFRAFLATRRRWSPSSKQVWRPMKKRRHSPEMI